MTHTYKVTGMTCGNCEAKVKNSLLIIPHVTGVEVSKEKQSAVITMDAHVGLSTLQQSLGEKYTISAETHSEMNEQAKSWLRTYKPILLIFSYILAISLLLGSQSNNFDWMKAMNIFMAGFFLTFSFLRSLSLKCLN